MKLRTLLLSATLLPLAAMAQTNPLLGAYTEPFDPTVQEPAAWQALGDGVQMSWASHDIHYAQRTVPAINMKQDTTVYAWRGERVGVQAVLFSKSEAGPLTLSLTGAPAGWTARAQFVNYVLSDGKRGCGNNDKSTAITYVPDVIDIYPEKTLKARSTTPVWITIEVPRDARAGDYQLTLTVNGNGRALGSLRLKAKVVDRTLPAPADYTFNTNLWQQPYSVAHHHNVPKWSQAHFNALRPYLEMLARCGQKSAFAVLFYEPWGTQSIDKHDEMIRSVKNSVTGEWSYDYTVFDHYVELCDSVGINKQINCFSMIPWGGNGGVNQYKMNFRYYDENGNTKQSGDILINSDAYKDIWGNFLKAFAQHLRQKGWFDKTYIAMDERDLGVMQYAYNYLQEVVPGMKMSLAGNYHSQLADKLADYCVAWNQHFTAAELANRDKNNWVTTTYTACPDLAPNLETYNDPADGAYIPVFCIANGFNGFLHWSWNQWTANPLVDSRGDMFPPGDYYTVYPGPRSGIRYERYIEGVQLAEKVYALRNSLPAGDTLLDSVNSQVEKFQSGTLTYANSSARLVNVLQAIVNGSPVPALEPSSEYCTTSLQNANKDVAIAQRWIESASFEGEALDMDKELSWSAKSTDGYVLSDDTLRLHPGYDMSVELKGTTATDGLQWCRVGLFADWDGDRNFGSRDDETVNLTGKGKQSNPDVLDYKVTLTVPADAKQDTPLRLRAVYNDAWGDVPDPCGVLMKGFCIDFPIIVSDKSSDDITVVTRPSKVVWTADGMTSPDTVTVNVYDMKGILVDTAAKTTSYSTAHFTPGTYIMKVVDAQGHASERKFTR